MAGLPEPEILEKDGGVSVTLFKVEESVGAGGQTGGQTSGAIGGATGGQDGGQDGGQVDTLTERQKENLKIIVDNPRISRMQLSKKPGINESAVKKHINALKKKRIIERESETTGQWTIKVYK